MFRVRQRLLRPRTKLALLTLAWVVWGFITVGGLQTAFASCADPANAEPGFDYQRDCNPDGTPRTQIASVAPSAPSPQQYGPPAPSAPSAGTGVQLRNPLSGISSIPDLLAAVLNVIIIIAIPIIIFFLMLAGFKYVTARGNPSTITEASQALLYAIIGGVLILGATAITQIIKNLVNAFRS